MDLQEQRLIEDLFARLKSVSAAEKDEDAGRLIRDLISRFPDAPYYLTQSVLVQQQALDRAKGNKTMAAGFLCMNRTTLSARLKALSATASE